MATTATGRTPQQIREHYEVERELADRLRAAPRQDRLKLYGAVYNELYRRVPHHSQLTRRKDAAQQREMVEDQLRLLRRFLTPQTRYLEVGAGDCAVTVEAARLAREAIAIDVSPEIAAPQGAPSNFRLIISDGLHIPVPAGSVDLVYSNQLMEHLHPEDALDQLRHIYDALAPGGRYVCITPNRYSGPHDVSKHFDRDATGFHLKEYTAGDLSALFRQVGFTGLTCYGQIKGAYVNCPLWAMKLLELKLSLMPYGLRRWVTRRSVVAGFLGLVLVGRKP